MSTVELFAAIDLSKYLGLVTNTVGQSAAIALASNNEVVSSAGVFEQVANTDLTPADGHKIVTRNLCDYQRAPIGRVLIGYESSTTPPTDASVDALAHCIQTELDLNTELLEMTDELTRRYEELNLVFANKNEEEFVDSTSRQLSDIVSNSHQYLQVDLCLMVLGNQNLHFESSSERGLQDLIPTLTEIAKPINAWLAQNPGSHVYNSGLEHELAVSNELREYRHIVTPISIGNSKNVTGFLLAGRLNTAPLFTNSDKNLLEVMAQKASKIIRSTYDDLTGLLRRGPFELKIEEAVENANEPPNRDGLFIIDMDRMQVVNEAFGHDAGDALLCLVAAKLEGLTGQGDVISRLGGDQFGVLIDGSRSLSVHRIAARIIDGINNLEFAWRGQNVEVSASAGITLISNDSGHAAHVLAEAELACSSAKEAGGARFEIFSIEDSQLVERHAQMHQVSVIQHALKHDRFVLYVQPIQPLADPSRALHAEVLIRLLDDSGEIVPPGVFLPAAERYNLMPSIDRWVVARSLQAFSESAVSGPDHQLVLTINLSGQSLSDTGFIDFVRHCLDQYKPRPGSICFEVTETTAIRDLTLAESFMTELRGRGVSFALDDFGTGLSSFSYLQKLPLDALKIDGSFVRKISDDQVAATMVRAINDVGHAMGLTTIAEFVTTEEIAAMLTSFGVDYGQGYALAKPLPLDAFLVSLAEATGEEVSS